MLANLIKCTNNQLAKAGLSLPQTGISEMAKRWKLPENQGGYSVYWKSVNAQYQQTDKGAK